MSVTFDTTFCFVFALSFNKIGCTSAISNKFDCLRFALSLHKIGCTSAISSKLDCIRFALSFNKASGEKDLTGSHSDACNLDQRDN